MSGAQVDWAVAARTKRGHGESGDQYAVFPDASGVLIAVVDGLGHGKEAAAAAHAAIGELQKHRGRPLERLVDQCHERLQGGRGVVMSRAWFRATGVTPVASNQARLMTTPLPPCKRSWH